MIGKCFANKMVDFEKFRILSVSVIQIENFICGITGKRSRE